jgi:cell division protein ZapA
MANVNIKFNNKEFLLSCEDGQEEHLEELSFHLNEKFNKLKSSLGNIGENKLLLITSISTMDEYFETKKKVDQKIGELKDLTEKFKELKSLIYEYKEKKDKEISNLNEEQKNLKNQLEGNKLDYEKAIEKATDQIENFLTKVDSENPLQ